MRLSAFVSPGITGTNVPTLLLRSQLSSARRLIQMSTRSSVVPYSALSSDTKPSMQSSALAAATVASDTAHVNASRNESTSALGVAEGTMTGGLGTSGP